MDLLGYRLTRKALRVLSPALPWVDVIAFSAIQFPHLREAVYLIQTTMDTIWEESYCLKKQVYECG